MGYMQLCMEPSPDGGLATTNTHGRSRGRGRKPYMPSSFLNPLPVPLVVVGFFLHGALVKAVSASRPGHTTASIVDWGPDGNMATVIALTFTCATLTPGQQRGAGQQASRAAHLCRHRATGVGSSSAPARAAPRQRRPPCCRACRRQHATAGGGPAAQLRVQRCCRGPHGAAVRLRHQPRPPALRHHGHSRLLLSLLLSLLHTSSRASVRLQCKVCCG